MSIVATTNPKVTVLIPTFNGAEYLAAAIDGVLSQTVSDFELIVLDNASTDNTPDIMARYTDPRLRTFRNENNLGFLGNVSKGRQLARGEFLVDIGSDDIWEPSMLARALDFFIAHPSVSFLHTAATWINETDEPIGQITVPWRTLTTGRDAFVEVFKYGFCFSGMFMRKHLLDAFGPINPSFDEMLDLWWFLRLSLRGDVGYIHDPLVRFRLHGRSLSAALYKRGKGFRQHIAVASSAFDWPEAIAAGLNSADRKTALRYLALDSVNQMHAVRDTGTRRELLSAFGGLACAVPSIALHPRTWVRLGFGMLPRSFIHRLRARKRRRQIRRLAGVASGASA